MDMLLLIIAAVLIMAAGDAWLARDD